MAANMTVKEKIGYQFKELGAQLKKLRLEVLQTDQKGLARLLGVSQTIISQWENGRYKPSAMALMAIGRMKGADKTYWFREAGQEYADIEEVVDSYKKDHPDWEQGDSGTRGIPLLRDPAAAGTGRAIDQNQIERTLWIPTDWLPSGGKLYAIKIMGDSMSPVLETGYVVIVDVSRKDPKELVGKMVLARDGSGMTVKWLKQDGGIYMLMPQQPSKHYPVRIFQKGSDLAIVGAVVNWTGWPP